MAEAENNRHADMELSESEGSNDESDSDTDDDEYFDDAVDDLDEINIMEVMDDEELSSEESHQEEDHANVHDFDRSLPAHHQYLGSNIEEFSGRTIFAEDQTIQLPILKLPSVVLFPGETLPLNFYMPNHVSMIRNLFTTNRTLGIVNLNLQNQQCQFGTTAEIVSVHADEEDGGISIKSIGRQRFKIKSTRRQSDGISVADVVIIQESYLPKYPAGIYHLILQT